MRCDGNVFDSFQTLGTNDVLHALWPAGSFFFLLPPISVSNNFTSSHANSYKHASSARLLLLGLILVKILMSLFLHILSMKFGIVCLATARHANYPVLPSKVSRERPTRHRYYINLSRWQS